LDYPQGEWPGGNLYKLGRRNGKRLVVRNFQNEDGIEK
jgi:hypothetical protein